MKSRFADLAGRWHWIALGLILGVLAGFYYLAKAPAIYQARATLLVKQQNSSAMFLRGGKDEAQAMDPGVLEALNTVAQRVTRPELLQKVAGRPDVRNAPGLMPRPVEWLPDFALAWFGKTPPPPSQARPVRQPPPPPAALAGAISWWTRIAVRPGTRLLDVIVSHPSPQAAATVANAIAVEYQAELAGGRNNGRDIARQILVEQSENARTRLQGAQNALAGYQHALATLRDLEAHEAALGELARRYLPKHPRLIAAQGEQAALRDRFLDEFETVRSSSADRAYWDGHRAEWEQAGADPLARLRTARRLLLARGTILESEITSQNSVYSSLITRIQKDGINRLADASQMEISSPARLPAAPFSPVPVKIIGIASGGGLACGLLLALLFTRLDHQFHSVARIERETGLPVIAALAALSPASLKTAARRRNTDPTRLPPPAARRVWSPMLLDDDPGCASTAAFADLVWELRPSDLAAAADPKRRLILFSSALPGEGKTFVSGNFALTAARQGKSTLLIDLDLRKPAVHTLFGLQRDAHPHGSSGVLAGQCSFDDAILTDCGCGHLHLMLAGSQAPNPGELLNSGPLAAFLAAATARYPLVVIDSAPLLAVPDTRIILPLVHQFSLVVRAGFVPIGAVRHAIALLRHDHNPPGGIVFNGFS